MKLSPFFGDAYWLETLSQSQQSMMRRWCRHSLVTPIDWKQLLPLCRSKFQIKSRHSLVTPIDWKRSLAGTGNKFYRCRSPFFGDAYWLETKEVTESSAATARVAILWWRLLIGNWRFANFWTSFVKCRHSLVTPIDWKLMSWVVSWRERFRRRHSLVTPIDWKQV